MTNFTVKVATNFHVDAETEEEAMELLGEGEYEELEVMSVVWNVS